MAIQIRRGTDAEWESNKSNIVVGEPAIATDTERVFVGTGSGTYMELASLDVLADAFDPSTTYAVGDYCTYQGKLYKFTTDHSGAWSSGDVEEITVTEVVGQSGGGDSLTEEIKQALLTIASKVAYIDEDGQDYYDALENALYPDKTLSSISAVFTQVGDVDITDTLHSLRHHLVVTATYSDSSTATVTEYELSGDLVVGTSTITVTYLGKTATFDVTVTNANNYLHYWDFTNSLTDLVTGGNALLMNVSERTSNGVTFSIDTRADAEKVRQAIELGNVFGRGKYIEVDMKDVALDNSGAATLALVSFWDGVSTKFNNSYNVFGYHYATSAATNRFGMVASDAAHWGYPSDPAVGVPTYFNGNSTLKISVASDGKMTFYKDGTDMNILYSSAKQTITNDHAKCVNIGGFGYGDYDTGYQTIRNATITKVRIKSL